MLTREKLQRGEGELVAENPLIGLRKPASHSENIKRDLMLNLKTTFPYMMVKFCNGKK
jgi:hypothetical protein